MKKFFKIFGLFLLGISLALYIAFLFVLPKTIDLNKFKPDLQKIAQEQANLNLDYASTRLITTPALGIGIKAENITVKLPDNSILFSSDDIKVILSLPKILLLTVNLPTVEINNPFLNIEILQNGEDYKIVKLVEDIINKNKETTFAKKPVEETNGFKFNPQWIKIVLPNIKLNNYKILITDLATNNYLNLHGSELVLGYFNGKKLKIKANSQLDSNENRNITANVDINTILPEPAPKLDKEDDPAEKIDIPFINPVTTYQNYDLKADLSSKLRIRQNKHKQITSFGYFNIENLTMKFSTFQLPKSYLKIKTFATEVNLDTDIYTTESENIHLYGKLNYGKKPNTNLSIKTGIIKFENILTLAKAILESLQIPNELNQYKAAGNLTADCNIKTNFKKLKSNGFIKIENGNLSVRDLGEILSNLNINLILDDNSLNIKDSSLSIRDSLVKFHGLIDKKSYTDINITTENVPLPILFEAFAPKEIRNNFDFNSAYISSSLSIKGKMKKAIAKATFKLNNFDFADKQNSFKINNEDFSAIFDYSAKTKKLAGDISNFGLKFIFPQTHSNISIPKTTITVRDKNIKLAEDTINLNDKTKIKYYGNIIDYEKLKNLNFIMQGNINAKDLTKFLGNELEPFISAKGNVPVNLIFSGDKNKQTLFVKVIPDALNYFTPINIPRFKGLKTQLQTKIDFKPKRIKIKDTGFFTRASVYDEEGNENVILNKIIGIDGTIENNNINLLKIDIPKNIDFNLQIFPQSILTLEHGKLFIYGKIAAPFVKGNLKIFNAIIPELSTALNSANFNFKEDEMHMNINKITLGNSDINITGKLSLIPDIVANIYDLHINSNYFNIEDITKVSEQAISYMPIATETTSNKVNSSTANIPISIHSGTVNMNKIITGNIELLNTKSNLTILKNRLALKQFTTDVFKGKVNGEIFVNLISILIDTNLKGSNIDVEKALLDSSGMKDSLSGTADFTSKLLINGAATTPEAQMAGINGDIDFTVKDGQFGPFGRLENLILAENIRESQFFQTALGGIINSIATIDTSHFSELQGHINLKDGMCNINPITSQGNVMNMHILGDFDLLKNYTDMKVRIKLTSIISNLLGPLNAINPINIMNSTASLNVVTAKAFSLFCETVTEEELAILPDFTSEYDELTSTKFQLGVRGDIAKPLTLIKSFKWLATQLQFDTAKEFTDTLPEPIEGSQATNIEEAIQEAQALEAEKKTIKYKIKNLFTKNAA